VRVLLAGDESSVEGGVEFVGWDEVVEVGH
jgi:hypothetical protein